MSHFTLRSLAFYGAAIGSVVTLFSFVSAYGNANLKAPPAIDGHYRLNAEKLPGCLQTEELELIIQQSGEYLNAALLPEGTIDKKAIPRKLLLAGKLQNQQLSLSGPIPQLTSCGKKSLVQITGKMQAKNLAGTITLNSLPKPTQFIAQKEPDVRKSENKH
ncbi:MAG: hypothetical protein U7123_02105 [Potamolinea sp.]